MSIGTIKVISPGWTNQFAHPFPPGLVPAGSGVQLGSLPTQTSVKRTWSDGSAKHAIIKANVPAAGDYPLSVIPNPWDTFSPTSWPLAGVSVVMRKHQDDNKAKANRFSLMFTEYVIDQALYLGEGKK